MLVMIEMERYESGVCPKIAHVKISNTLYSIQLHTSAMLTRATSNQGEYSFITPSDVEVAVCSLVVDLEDFWLHGCHQKYWDEGN